MPLAKTLLVQTVAQVLDIRKLGYSYDGAKPKMLMKSCMRSMPSLLATV